MERLRKFSFSLLETGVIRAAAAFWQRDDGSFIDGHAAQLVDAVQGGNPKGISSRF
jgi:hypothetical protein